MQASSALVFTVLMVLVPLGTVVLAEAAAMPLVVAIVLFGGVIAAKVSCPVKR